MAKVNVILDTRRELVSGEYPLKISVYHKGTFYINLDITLQKNQWDDKVVAHPQAKKLNLLVDKALLDVNKQILELEIIGKLKKLSTKELQIILMGGNPFMQATCLIHHAEAMMQKMSSGTRRNYVTTINKIKDYAKSNTLEFKDVNVLWLDNFESYLIENNCKINTVWSYMKCLRSVFNDAISKDVIEVNCYPFRKFKLRTEITRKRNLSIDKLREFIDHDCSKSQERYRNLFLLMFYLIGINIKDLLYAVKQNGDRLEYCRAKTGKLYSIKIEPEAQIIIDKYQGDKHLLHFIENRENYSTLRLQMNNALKKIGKNGTPICDEMTTYYARHSWATIASKIGIQRDTIAAALGHGGNTVTDIYIEFDTTKVDEANRRVIDYVLQKGEFAPNKISDI